MGFLVLKGGGGVMILERIFLGVFLIFAVDGSVDVDVDAWRYSALGF